MQFTDDDSCHPAVIVNRLKLCADQRDIHTGLNLHAELARRGLVRKDVYVASALINVYAKCAAPIKAQEVFDELPVRNLVLWTAIISAYTQHGHFTEALLCFGRMQNDGFCPDAATFVCILKAYGSMQAACEGQKMHAEILKEGLLGENIIVANALIDMYTKCAFLLRAEQVFDELSVRNTISWNAMLTGFVENGIYDEAFICFEQMQSDGYCADEVTFLCALKSCGNLGAICLGQSLHDNILQYGFRHTDLVLGTSLVDMYANCGMLLEAEYVFKKISGHDTGIWNALISGYTLLGKSKVLFESLNSMRREGIKPSVITFNVVLNACSYEGLITTSESHFERMSCTGGHGIDPTVEHYTCMVDAYCRTGDLDKVIALIKEMPFCADLTVWQTVLDACQKWENKMLGRFVFNRAVLVYNRDPSVYVCLANMYQ